MVNNIKDTLKELGLTDGEVKVYYALIGLGESTVGMIIRKSCISSSKVYVVLDKLIERGLVNYIMKEKTKHFSISQPVALVDYVEREEDRLRGIKDGLGNVIEQINSAQKNKASNEEARIYKGYRGLKSGMFEATKSIPSGGKYFFFSTGYGEDPYLKQFFRDLALGLKNRKIEIKGLAHFREKDSFLSYYKKYGYKMRFTDIAWPSDITIAGDFLLILVWDKDEPVLYSIQSRVLVESYKMFFENLWDNGEK